MRLNELIVSINSENYNLSDAEVTSIEFDSRQVTPGAIFIAIAGENFDGHDFIADVQKNGAVAVITQKKVATELPQIVVQDTKTVMGKLARRFYGEFTQINKIGITGTNGKTTTAFLIHSILTAAGKNPGLIGTVYYLSKRKMNAGRTTPESLDIFKLLDQFSKDGAQAVVMEISSHALSLKRVDELRFSSVIFTNFSQDHLDFHKTMEGYKKAKMHIFSLLDEDGIAIYNVDDPMRKAIEALQLKRTITYGVENRGDILGKIIEDNINGLDIEVEYRNEKYKIHSELFGRFNIYNICAAFATGIAMDIERATIMEGIEGLTFVRGRMERVVDNIFVDYAHTPSAIENALTALKHYTNGRVIIVFGCGGNRDKTKRPKMGDIATRLADFAVITSDNPRNQSPRKIIEDIERGIKRDNYIIMPDRKEAIEYAISHRQLDDIVFIAGKGHEEYQIIGDKIIKFDDAKVARACIENL